MKKNNLLLFLFLLSSFFSCKKNTTNIRLEKGMVISESVTIVKDIYKINSDAKLEDPAILIKGENIVIDFQGATLKGSNDKNLPNEYYGEGILVEGENIEIKNLTVRKYETGLKANGVKKLKISNSDFSNNFRPDSNFHKIHSDDLLGYKTGHGLTIVTCDNFILNNIKSNQNEHGVFIINSNNGIVYNSEISFNSKKGIIMMSSNQNKVMNNFLDWNINKLRNNHKSSAISISKDSRDNIFAYNSISHSGKNEFRKNIVYQNNFFPFSEDSIYQNQITEKVPPLPDGQKTSPPNYKYWGEQYILFNDWGPYNFEYPAIWLREVNDDKYTFAIFGPEGNWKIVDGNGFVKTSRQSGSIPATIVATKEKNANPESLSLDLEFIGVKFTDQFGNINPRGKTTKFQFKN